MKNVLPGNAEWIQEPVIKVEASGNYVVTQAGIKVFYEYLVIAAGLRLDYDKVCVLQVGTLYSVSIPKIYHLRLLLTVADLGKG